MTVDIEHLYRTHGHIVLRRARRLLGNEHEAQEALQDIFASLLHDPGAVRDVKSVAGWIYQATTHWCLNHLRNRRTGKRLLDERPAPPAIVGPHAEDLAEVRNVLARLPSEVAAAAVYHHVDGMTHDEVATLLGCSRRKVGYLLERARQSLEPVEQSA